MSVCPLCNGDGHRVVVTTHKVSGLKKTSSMLCLCTQSKLTSADPNLCLLKWLGDRYLPYDEIDNQLAYNSDLSKSPNALIIGTSFGSFCLHVKSRLMQMRAMEPAPYIYACRGIDVLHDFYVQQNDGTSPRLSETEKFDLMVFTLDTEEKNDKLKTVIAQVVYTRRTIMKPTWIYMPKPALSQCTQEYSQELDQLLEVPDEKSWTPQHYRRMVLADKDGRIGVRQTEAKKAAANFVR